jgi:hypothetical protein
MWSMNVVLFGLWSAASAGVYYVYKAAVAFRAGEQAWKYYAALVALCAMTAACLLWSWRFEK